MQLHCCRWCLERKGRRNSVQPIKNRKKTKVMDSTKTPTDSHPWMVYISTLFASVLPLLIGYNQAIISGAMLFLVVTYQLDSLWQQLITTSNTVGCACALFLTGYPVQIFGRKKMILASNAFLCIGAVISAAAPTKEVVLFGRFMAGMGGGYNQAIISGAIVLLVDTYQLVTLWQQLTATSNTVGCAFALFLTGYPVQIFGRKTMILAANTFMCIGAVISAAAPAKEVVLVGRFLTGMGGGAVSVVVPMYISECAPVEIRGRLGSFTQCLLSVGVFLASIVAGAFSGMVEAEWRWMFACSCVIDVVHFVGFLFLPESPRWFMDRGREKEAEAVLKQLRNNQDEINKELADMKKSVAEGKQLKLGEGEGSSIIARMMKTPPVRRALLVGICLGVTTQITWVGPIVFYSGIIFRRAGFSGASAIWMTAIPGGIMALSSFTLTCLIERFGRKHLYLGAQIGQFIALVILGLGFFLSATNSPAVSDDIQIAINNATSTSMCNFRTCEQCIDSPQCGFCYDVLSRASCVPVSVNGSATAGRCSSSNFFNSSDFTLETQACPSDYKWIPVIGSSVFLAVFGAVCGVVFVVIAEIFPLWARGTCSSTATAAVWICQILVSVTFLSVAQAITVYGLYWLHAGCAMLSVIYILIFMPETKGVRLEEVERLFMTPNEKNAPRRKDVDSNL